MTLFGGPSFFGDDEVESFEVILVDFFSLSPLEVFGLVLGSGSDPLHLIELQFILVDEVDRANVKDL